MAGYYLVIALALCVDYVQSSHFMGATIRWKSDPLVDNKVSLFIGFNFGVKTLPLTDNKTKIKPTLVSIKSFWYQFRVVMC